MRCKGFTSCRTEPPAGAPRLFPSFVLVAIALACLVARPAAAQDSPFSSCKQTEPIRMLSQTPEPIDGRPGAVRWTLTGNPVVVVCDDTTLMANTLVYESDSKAIHASGDVVLRQPDLTLSAARADLNGDTKLGTFYDAAGMARIGDEPAEKSPFGTMEPDVTFAGERIEKLGPKTYRIHRGRFTTCIQPTPRWEVTSGDATLTLDKHALLKNVVLRVKDVPILYLPAFYYPMDKGDRATGFLLPTYGASTFRGTTLSNAFFWAISRSQDATFFHDWTTKSGQGIGSQYRYVSSPDARGTVNFSVFNSPEASTSTGDIVAGRRSMQVDGDANQGLPAGFRLIGRVNYFTDAATQQMYQDVYDSGSRQQRSINAMLTGNVGAARLSATFDRNDYFYGANGTRTGRAPSVNVSLPDRTVGRTKLYVGTSADMSYLVRQDDLSRPDTDHSLWRLDGNTRIRAPLSSLSFLSVTADASWRLTYWTESIDPLADAQVPVGLGRQLFELRTQVVGPTVSRIFQRPNGKYADRFKHVIEPTFRIRRTTTFREFDRVVQNDYSVDGQVGGVTQIDYGVSNKVLARRPPPPAAPGAPPRPGVTRQILTVDLMQSYYSNALAARYDSQYQSVSAGSFGPLRLQASTRPADRVTGQFGMEIDAKYRAVTILSATGRLESDRTELTLNWSKRRRIRDVPEYQYESHFLSGGTRVRSRTNHVGGEYRFTIDMGNRRWVQQRVLAYYNSQCCGVSVDWQQIDSPLLSARGVPTNHQFGISFTLAGVGSFANPLGSFGGAR